MLFRSLSSFPHVFRRFLSQKRTHQLHAFCVGHRGFGNVAVRQNLERRGEQFRGAAEHLLRDERPLRACGGARWRGDAVREQVVQRSNDAGHHGGDFEVAFHQAAFRNARDCCKRGERGGR
jgi:hypothetical protein